MDPPKIRGAYELYFDATPLPAGKPIVIPPSARLRTVALKVRVEHPEDGLLEPLVFRCGPAPAALGDWRDLGLDWYSGRGVYRTSFRLPDSYAGHRLVLDLGDLRYTGEVWLNGRLVDSLAWPPYEADISRFARAGENDLVVVVANLLANQMRWNLFDSVIPSQFSRWWHDGSILREADHLRSGLFGPVRIRATEE
jgi:hypothetical protein